MNLVQFMVKAGIYLLSFIVSFYAMRCVNYEKILKIGHVQEAQVLYFLLIIALAYLVGSFVLVFFY